MERHFRKLKLSRRSFLALSIAATASLAARNRFGSMRARALEHGPLTPFLGPAKTARVLAVYMDYHCPFCRAMDPLLPRLAERNPRLQIEFKELPVLRWDSEVAARIALVAQKFGKYMEVHERLMRERGDFTGAAATRIAEWLKIDPIAFRREMGSAEVSAEIAKNLRDAEILGIEATPGLVTLRTVLQGALSFEQLQSLVNVS